jgi:hypothetical protein
MQSAIRRSVIALALLVFLGSLAGVSAQQQGVFPPAQLTNLQVFPKDTPVPAVVDAMKKMTQALGVRCDHCHVGVDGQPLTSFDFVSDTKPTKNTARAMMRLVEQINGALDKALPAATTGRVTCVTCHNGRRTPQR